ncbi:hypothetical protein [Paludisphaera rhizosphaerae]|uniref:hypothetical protein n=1 Tax=Paludisphaera rhizosphaerae TaxID=2711216 RepID=UPI0013EA38DE|nr:hypothetical protein [Paludisphaera rhizosphaerae]
MGVTSYCYGEVLLNETWVFPGGMEANPEYYPEDDEPEFRPHALFESSIKELTAILNGSNTTIRSNEPYASVTPRRGLPSDLSEPLEKWLRRYEHVNGFNANWFTLAESNTFGWESRLMKRQAMVDPRVAELFRGCPRGFPFERWPRDLPISYSSWHRGGVEVEWTESYAEIVPDFYKEAIPRLAMLGPPDRVRMVVASFR